MDTRMSCRRRREVSEHISRTDDLGFTTNAWQNLWFGWAEYQPATQTFEMWIDEIAVDSSRIGCVL